MRKLLTVTHLALFALLGLLVQPNTSSAQTRTAFNTGERTTGSTKQCFYSAAGSEYTRTFQSYQVCPVTIQVSTGR